MDDFHVQGGTPVDGVHLDLSSCVSRHGLPPGVRGLLACVDDDVVLRHPYAATARVSSAFAERFDLDPSQVAVTSGISAALSALQRSAVTVVVPAPYYTEYAVRFPDGCGAPRWMLDLHAVASALAAGRHVVLSNPVNPTGQLIPDEQLEAAARGASGVLVVDESYREFVDDGPGLMATSLDNVAVLRSVSKFHALPGVRVGTVWSPRRDTRDRLADASNWPITEWGARLAAAAVTDRAFENTTRALTSDDLARLTTLVHEPFAVVGTPRANFALVTSAKTGQVEQAHAALLRRGIRVRLLDRRHGLPDAALRITAPRADEDMDLIMSTLRG